MSDTQNVLATLRKMVMSGEIAPGEKLVETAIAERIGVSRTPVRLAFRSLEQEGLLRKRETRGYVVREFTENDIHCALEVRGALEGIAARRLAQAGLSDEDADILRGCLSEGNELFAKGFLSEEDIDAWEVINRRFHETIIKASQSAPIEDAIARNNHLPFASSDSLIIDTSQLDKEYQKLQFAHIQHQAVVEAICCGEGARAENLMREHAYVGLRYGKIFGIAAPSSN